MPTNIDAALAAAPTGTEPPAAGPADSLAVFTSPAVLDSLTELENFGGIGNTETPNDVTAEKMARIDQELLDVAADAGKFKSTINELIVPAMTAPEGVDTSPMLTEATRRFAETKDTTGLLDGADVDTKDGTLDDGDGPDEDAAGNDMESEGGPATSPEEDAGDVATQTTAAAPPMPAPTMGGIGAGATPAAPAAGMPPMGGMGASPVMGAISNPASLFNSPATPSSTPTSLTSAAPAPFTSAGTPSGISRSELNTMIDNAKSRIAAERAASGSGSHSSPLPSAKSPSSSLSSPSNVSTTPSGTHKLQAPHLTGEGAKTHSAGARPSGPSFSPVGKTISGSAGIDPGRAATGLTATAPASSSGGGGGGAASGMPMRGGMGMMPMGAMGGAGAGSGAGGGKSSKVQESIDSYGNNHPMLTGAWVNHITTGSGIVGTESGATQRDPKPQAPTVTGDTISWGGNK